MGMSYTAFNRMLDSIKTHCTACPKGGSVYRIENCQSGFYDHCDFRDLRVFAIRPELREKLAKRLGIQNND